MRDVGLFSRNEGQRTWLSCRIVRFRGETPPAAASRVRVTSWAASVSVRFREPKLRSQLRDVMWTLLTR